jgi:hypothetical protein
VSLKLAFLIIATLSSAFFWTFAAPYVTHWKARRAAARRRLTEGRRR